MADDHMEIFLDLDPSTDILSDENVGESMLRKLKSITTNIGKRAKSIRRIGISYDTPSVAIYDQAKDLYCFGYFFSSIVVSRSVAERLAYEIFYEEVQIEGDNLLIESVAENLDFRKIVNEFLYNEKKGFKVIDKDTHDLFNEIYTIGNMWVHPKTPPSGVKIEDVAYRCLKILGSLLNLRDVLKDNEIINGKLVRKPTARKKLRPIKLGAGR